MKKEKRKMKVKVLEGVGALFVVLGLSVALDRRQERGK